jgi:hypothetical protein
MSISLKIRKFNPKTGRYRCVSSFDNATSCCHLVSTATQDGGKPALSDEVAIEPIVIESVWISKPGEVFIQVRPWKKLKKETINAPA